MSKHVRPNYLLLAIWLIVTGGTGLLGIGHPIITLALEILAVVTGIVILVELGGMSRYERLGMIFLAIWLILTGVLPIIGVGIPYSGTIMIVLAILAGVLLLVGIKGKKTAAKLGIILLAIWLIATAVLPLLGVVLVARGVILAALAVIAGILIIVGK
jgi:hypothetical protein